MKHGDFYDSEQSHLITLSTTAPAAGAVAVGEAAITAAATDAAATTIPPAAVATAAAAPAKTYVKIEHTGMDGLKRSDRRARRGDCGCLVYECSSTAIVFGRGNAGDQENILLVVIFFSLSLILCQ